MIEKIRSFLSSRPLKLTFSTTLLVACVLFAADFMDLRGDRQHGLREARKMVAEALAVQLSTLASSSDLAGIKLSVAALVERNPDVVAVSLDQADGSVISESGELSRLPNTSDSSTMSRMNVPIFSQNSPWGSLRIAFVPINRLQIQLRYMGFVLLSCFVLTLLFMRKVLVQLDPSQAVPGRVNSAFNLFSEGVVVLDDKLRILMANEAAAVLVGKTPEQLIGSQLDDWPWQQPADWQPPWTTALHSELKLDDHGLHLRQEDGETRVLVVSCKNVGNEQEGKRGVLVTLDDMTAIEVKNSELALTLRELRVSQESINQKNKELEALATQDPLTGLANRRALMVGLEREFAEATRESGSLSCIMVDIDHFKRINDTYGHGVGDDVIRAVANTLVAECRESDIVGRFGGEEFVVALPGSSATEALDVAERVRVGIRALVEHVNIPVQTLSASLGVSSIQTASSDVKQLLEQADEALYAAKQSGRDRVILHDPDALRPAGQDESEFLSTQRSDSNLSRVVELEAIVQKRSQDLDVMREYDSLTGIPKRTLFMQRIESEVQRAVRQDTKIGVMSIEIKGLNRIVSSFGHQATDALIVDFVARLQEGLRSTDLVAGITEDHSMSLITTNEYGVVLSDLDDSAQAMPVIVRLRRLLSTPFDFGDQKIYLGVNIGISLYPQGGRSAGELMESACHARTEAAQKPDKVSHCFVSASLEKASRDYISLESDLHQASEDNAFEVYYQPKFDLVERKIKGLEALLRWKHPEKGFISPADFIPVAEANGLIHEISAFVLSECLAQIKQWESMGLSDLRVSVNISPLQLRDPLLISDIVSAMKSAGVSSSSIEIELTETSVFESPERARIVLERMREIGLSVAMDDFGTGYTSLGLLADLPLDVVKIDRSFVVAMDSSQRSRAIVESVINMAHALKLRTVAEGVETNEQLATLAALGCDEIQGYLICRPLPADQITLFLQQQGERRIRAVAG